MRENQRDRGAVEGVREGVAEEVTREKAKGVVSRLHGDSIGSSSPPESPSQIQRASLLHSLTRREMMVGGIALAGLAVWPRSPRAAEPYSLSPVVKAQLKKNSLVYISPLKSNGEESRCHGEVWYFVDGEAVVIGAASTRWKVRAVQAGLDEARLWVGDFGMGRAVGDRYKAGASFRARAETVKDDALFGRLLTAYGERYAAEWGKWKPRFEKGYAEGTRVLIRYTPIGA